jgi:hypothetical protein
MNDFHRIAQLITCCWRLADDGHARIPTSHSILDRALRQLIAENEVPSWLGSGLTFVDSRIGLQCVELPSILEWAQRAQLTSAPNPSYETTEVQISPRVASRFLATLGISEDAGRDIGNRLKEYAAEFQQELVLADHASIEDY